MPKKPVDPLLEAHTPAAAGGEAAQAALPGADPDDLLAGTPDLDANDLLALVAEPVLTQRRARGRPKGAANRKNGDMIGYLQALGHRDPWVTLSLIQSADFAQLCRVVGADTAKTRIQVLGLVKGAAEALMNYHHSKKPQQLDLPVGDKRPLMVIGDGNNIAIMAGQGFASDEFMPPDDSEQNQGLIDGEAVRHKPDQSHG